MDTNGWTMGGYALRIIFLTSIVAAAALFFGRGGLGLHHGGDGDGLVASVASAAGILFGGSPARRSGGASRPRTLWFRTANLAELADPKSTEARTGRRADLAEHMDPRSVALRAKHVREMEVGLVRCERARKWWQDGRTRLVTVPEFYEAKDGCWHDFLQDITFFHVGKGGGGTVEYELKSNHFLVSVSHPGPKPLHIEKLQKGPLATLIVNVRDPVDRFVSAFKWVLLQYCGPGDPRSMCTPKRIEQESRGAFMLREKYNSDPNLIAEALCEESPLREEASADYHGIGHSRTLVSWFQFLIDPSMRDSMSEDGIRHLMVVPMEKRGGESLFEQHIQHLMLELLQTRYGLDTAVEILTQGLQSDDVSVLDLDPMVHSTGRVNTPALSTLGECCLARHLRDDYRLIRTMLGGFDVDAAAGPPIEPLAGAHPLIGGACSWGGEEQRELCRSDLRSILSRRAPYLDRSADTCAQHTGVDV